MRRWAVMAAFALAGCGSAEAATVERYSVRSDHAHRKLRQVAMLPQGGTEGRPLLVFLHGRGARGEEGNANPAFAKALEAQGRRAPVVVFPSGATASYWHKRRSGDWARYVLDEVIPEAVERFNADETRVAIGGISMGGYGAYEIGRRRGFCAVGGHSAAFWLRAGDSAPGAFDDAADFERHDVLELAQRRGRKPWRGAELWLDAGAADPFRAANAVFARRLNMRLRLDPGGHDGAYWASHYRDYLRFYARALARC